jgi:hypothetical protein
LAAPVREAGKLPGGRPCCNPEVAVPDEVPAHLPDNWTMTA